MAKSSKNGGGVIVIFFFAFIFVSILFAIKHRMEEIRSKNAHSCISVD
jgi:hypothetical protein